MAGLSRRLAACLHTGQLALLAILVSGGIVLQILACALYNNWWPLLTGSKSYQKAIYSENYLTIAISFLTISAALMYIILPMPLLFFMGSNSSSLMSSEGDGWANFTKFLTGFSVVGSIAIPSILKHANLIGWGALMMELSSFAVFCIAIVWLLRMNNQDDYNFF